MEQFVVSARKYRPKGFDQVVGQEHITTTLQNAITNSHLGQALLFCGPRGVGKTTCARILAKMVNGFDEDDNASNLNIYELDAASNNSVDDIRSLVEQVRFPPQQGNFKVYIIDEVHMLSNAAFNAFLKTLEEPPPYAIFILATTEKHKIIPTILSRCQIFDFNRIQISDISNHLAKIAENEKVEAEPEALHLIAQKADGALRDALSIFDLIVTFSSGNKVTYQATIDNLHILDYDYYFKITDSILEGDLSNTLLIFDEILNNGFDGHIFIVGFAQHLRNLLVSKDNATIKLLEVSDNIKAKYQEQANASSLSFLLSALNIASTCDQGYKNSKNQRLHVELALMKTAHLNEVLSLDLGEIKKKNSLTTEKKTVEQPSQPVNTPIQSLKSITAAPAEEKKEAATQPVKAFKSEAPVQPNNPPKKGVIKKTLKFSDIGAKQEATVTKETVEESRAEADEFSYETLQKHWSSYIEEINQAGKINLYTTLKNSDIILDGVKVIIQVDNKLQVENINAVKEDLMQYIRPRLNNYQIYLETQVVRQEKKDLMYTAQDKYNYLVKEYPQLEVLKKELGLELGF